MVVYHWYKELRNNNIKLVTIMLSWKSLRDLLWVFSLYKCMGYNESKQVSKIIEKLKENGDCKPGLKHSAIWYSQ